MKKLFTLLVICFTMFSLQSNAQLSCNPAFATQFLNGTTIKFLPATNDSPAVQHYWVFGDFSTPSALISPIHQYLTNGVFTVTHYLVRRNPNNVTICTDSATQTITIAQGVCNLNASFYSNSTASSPLTKQYTNTSANFSPGDSIRWNFGDGTVSYNVNPTHTFANYGIYNVCLRVKKANNGATTPPCISETCHLDTVAVICNVQAYFTNSTDSGAAPTTIQFTNQTVGLTAPDFVNWNFGDGTFSTLLNPVHVYTTPGVYNVCLTITKNNTAGTLPCTSIFCKTISISGSCNLVSNFTFYRDSLITIPNSYHFTNTTVPLSVTDSIRWTFGDGASSNQVNPNHAYAQPGTYTVCLRVIKRTPTGAFTNCVSEICHTVIVIAPNPCNNLQIYFSDSINVNFVHFINQSIGYVPGDSIIWAFGDGTTSHDANPNHTYSIAGTYTVCLLIRKYVAGNPTPVLCSKEYCKTITVSTACTLVANFIWYRDSFPTIANNTYHFTNNSAPLNANDSIRWTFGDGTSSNQINPIHVYAQSGNYNVCLRVIKRTATGALTNCVSEICLIITVPQQCNLVVNYTHRADSANHRLIYFTNTTTSPNASTSVVWSFGDGTTATTFNAAHEYLQPGRYYVCLRVQYGTCVSYKCDSLTVIVNPPTCAQLSQYSFVKSPTNNNIISFSPNVIDNTVQYTWTFGDGTGSQIATPTHQFANVGYYTVCLTAFRNSGCATTTCKTVYVTSTINCNNITLGFNDVKDTLVPNRITFFASSNTAITNQLWTIAKLPTTATTGTATIISNNPTYVFLDSGYYRVCLKVTFAGGCLKEFCKTIHIAQQMPFTSNCNLQVYPNPTSTYANAIVTIAQPLVLNGYIYNSTNMLVAQKQQQGFVGSNAMSIYVGALPAGVYSFRLLYGNQVCTSTFVKL